MYNLDKFIDQQDIIYSSVVDELKSGRKSRHWMWYIFPQIKGLGKTSRCKKFELSTLEEAKAYVQHPILGSRLKECTAVVNELDDFERKWIFHYPDDLKFISCMTLFEKATEDNGIFQQGLMKYCNGERDQWTLDILSGKPLPEYGGSIWDFLNIDV